MKTFDKLVMIIIAVSNMGNAVEFYEDKLGFEITSDYSADENNRWVSLDLPGGGTTITLTTHHEHMKPGTMKLYLSTPDIQAAYKQLTAKGVSLTSEINNDLYGPGSGVQWFSVDDPDGNYWIILQP